MIKEIRKNNEKTIGKKILKKAKGITLISLVITIIILLILAGVTINLTLGENGIFKTAEMAGKNYTQAQEQELAGLVGFENTINNIIAGSNGGSGASDVAYEEKIKELEQTIEDLKNKQATGDATAEQVLEGATFSNSSEIGITGTMANRGTLDFNPSGSATQNVEPGYYSGGTLNSSGAYNAGVAAGQNKVNWQIINRSLNYGYPSTNATENITLTIPNGYTKFYGMVTSYIPSTNKSGLSVSGATQDLNITLGNVNRVIIFHGSCSGGKNITVTANTYTYGKEHRVTGILVYN